MPSLDSCCRGAEDEEGSMINLEGQKRFAVMVPALSSLLAVEWGRAERDR